MGIFKRTHLIKKEHIYIVSGLMSFALLGLIGLQSYWIKLSIDANEEELRHDTHDALVSVSEQLEKLEAIYVANKVLSSKVDVIDEEFTFNTDSLGTSRWQESKTIKTRQQLTNPFLSQDGFVYEVEEKSTIHKSGIARKVKLIDIQSENLSHIYDDIKIKPQLDTSSWFGRINKSLAQKVSKKSEMVATVLDALVKGNESKHITERINKHLLDSLLKHEMLLRGIDIPYLFGVHNDQSGIFELSNAPEKKAKILKSRFHVKLFPSDVLSNHHSIYVTFPNEDTFVVRQIWGTLTASIGFILLIIACFLVAVMTIFRQKKLSQATKDFISNMTHELKTPIATVSLTTEALLDPDIQKMSTLTNRYLNVIKEENNRLAIQVDRVLQIAQLDKKDFKLKISEFDIHQVIKKVTKNIEIQIKTKDGKLTTNLEAENSIIQADQVHITNIIFNLLDNANKYSPKIPDIKIHTISSEKSIKIAIIDKGKGMNKENVKKIFDKFYRVPTGNLHDVKGFGLGLSYVQTMVEAHKGTIEVRSELGTGTTFTVTLPHFQSVTMK